MSGKRFELLGGVAGLLVVLLVVAVVVIDPPTPGAEEPGAAIAETLTGDRARLAAFGVVLALTGAALVVFAAAVCGLLRRAEGNGPGASWVAFAGAIGTSLVLVLSQAVLAAAMHAAAHEREPAAVGALFELATPIYGAVALTQALFLGGVALSSVPTRALPAWLSWPAAVLALLLLVSLPSTFSEEEGGGLLGIPFFVAELGFLVWVLATSVVLLLRGR